MEPVAIQGVGLVGGFGCGHEALLRTVREGQTPSQRVEDSSGAHDAGSVVCSADIAPLDEYIARRKLRRTGRFSRLAMLAMCEALADCEGLGIDKQRLGIVTGTGYGALGATFGFLDSVLDDGDKMASPTLFSNSVHSAAMANASIVLGIKGPGLTVSQFEISVHGALLCAAQWLQEGRVDAVLCGGVDEYSAVLGYCHASFFGVQGEGVVQPLEFATQSAVVGEGAGYLLLTRDDGGQARYGRVLHVQTGRLGHERPAFSEPGICVVGADGDAGLGQLYAEQLPEQAILAAYSPAYGSFPAAAAMDLAIAAIGLERGTLPIWPGVSASRGARPGQDLALDERRIDVFKIGREGSFGLATLSR